MIDYVSFIDQLEPGDIKLRPKLNWTFNHDTWSVSHGNKLIRVCFKSYRRNGSRYVGVTAAVTGKTDSLSHRTEIVQFEYKAPKGMNKRGRRRWCRTARKNAKGILEFYLLLNDLGKIERRMKSDR